MCRLFPFELVEAIMTGGPPSTGAIEAVAEHMRHDLITGRDHCGAKGYGLSGFIHALASVALVGSPRQDTVFSGAPLLSALLESGRALP